MDREILENALINREFVYRYAWRFFATEPDDEMLQLVTGDTAAEQLALFAGDDSPVAHAQAHLAQLAAETSADALSTEFTRLFLGPAKPVAPLWESVYREPDELIFQQTTLDVREAYRAAGFEARAYPHEADDHLAIELDFMAALGHRALEAAMQDNPAGAVRYLLLQKAFIEEHLALWVGDVFDRLAATMPESFGDFYLYAVALVREVCKTDLQVIADLVEGI